MSKKKRKIQTSTLPTAYWRFVAKSYLAIAQVGIYELSEKNYLNTKKDEDNVLYRTQWQIYDGKLLLMPIFWSIKHAIEVMLKAHSVAAQKNYLKTHNIEDLKNNLTTVFKISNPSKDKYLNEIVEIVDRYYKLRFFDGRLPKSQVIFDKDNDIFRYPEGNKAKLNLDLHLFQKITDEEINKLSHDINILNRRISIPADYDSLRDHWDNFSKV